MLRLVPFVSFNKLSAYCLVCILNQEMIAYKKVLMLKKLIVIMMGTYIYLSTDITRRQFKGKKRWEKLKMQQETKYS